MHVITRPRHRVLNIGITGNAGMVITGTFPLFDDQIAVRQAHIAWLAAQDDTGMQATLPVTWSSIDPRPRSHPSTGTSGITWMRPAMQARTAQLSCRPCSTWTCSSLTDAQAEAAGGDPVALRAQVQSAVAGTPAIDQLEDRYWENRYVAELTDFDEWIKRVGAPIATVTGERL